ncbi:3-deoxy-manno-octulosonate cytidylyltransferase [Vibrio japonicus]|uniref:3-deoxy-manno-octulosonate cytidylyltransferase n=1 Tax=Vibrio japonicus TaxID=1824638 RepID=A0ABY5LEJ4_9VIBR|nr:3-deoxy-manno-octulosonate cytidylyltransferase [Vibrio japonicus]UUM30463.1 3-deoxy-manno-octulosonate cytidylyltransferase [Vibrio japonicus]
MSKIRVVIPSRYGSSRLEGKPLLEILNKPVFWHVYQRCCEAGFHHDDIVLATDDMRIFQKASELGLNVVMTSSNHDSGTDRIFEVATLLDWNDQDIVINVQGDEPLIDPVLIRQVGDFAKNRNEFDIVTAVTSIDSLNDFQNPNIVKAILGLNNLALYFSRSPTPYNRDLPSCTDLAFRHIGIYAYSIEVLSKFCSFGEAPLEAYEKLEQLRAISNGLRIGACHYHGELSHGVDTLPDYLAIKTEMEQNK